MYVINQPATPVANLAAGIGAGRGVAIALNNENWARVTAVAFDWVCDATVGNRAPCLELRDSQGNVLAAGHTGSAVTAGSTTHFMGGPGMPETGANFARSFLPFPDNLPLPPGAYVCIIDADNIGGTADTIAARVTVADSLNAT